MNRICTSVIIDLDLKRVEGPAKPAFKHVPCFLECRLVPIVILVHPLQLLQSLSKRCLASPQLLDQEKVSMNCKREKELKKESRSVISRILSNVTHLPSISLGTSTISSYTHEMEEKLTSPVFSSTVMICPKDSWRSLIGTPRFAILLLFYSVSFLSFKILSECLSSWMRGQVSNK
jgi:hypothetical protein